MLDLGQRGKKQLLMMLVYENTGRSKNGELMPSPQNERQTNLGLSPKTNSSDQSCHCVRYYTKVACATIRHPPCAHDIMI